MEWLLSRIDDLKKRAYLAKFLVKVEIPPEVVSDPDLSEMYDQVREDEQHRAIAFYCYVSLYNVNVKYRDLQQFETESS